jgi:hypothetical protein
MIHQHNFELKTDSTVKKQGSELLRKPRTEMIREVSSLKEYYKCLHENKEDNKNYSIPILRYIYGKSDRNYEHYYTIIYTTMITVLAKFTKIYKEYGRTKYKCHLAERRDL